ncbi:hypothetical protein LINGRAHAP2_LOCUS2021, partial [Linum grandiflorum]
VTDYTSLFSEIDTIMLKLKQSGNLFDEFGYEDHPVLCNCGLQASCHISHTSQNSNRKFFGCSNYKAKDSKGCRYFEWYDVKVAVVNEKLRMANVFESLTNKVQDLRVENLALQASIHRSAGTPRGSANHAPTSGISNIEAYTLCNKLKALKARVD